MSPQPRGTHFVRVWTKSKTILLTTPDFDTFEGADRMAQILWASWTNDKLRAWSIAIHRISDGVCVKNLWVEHHAEPKQGSWA